MIVAWTVGLALLAWLPDEEIDALMPFIADRLVNYPLLSPALLASKPLATVADLAQHTLLHSETRPVSWERWLAAAGSNRRATAHHPQRPCPAPTGEPRCGSRRRRCRRKKAARRRLERHVGMAWGAVPARF